MIDPYSRPLSAADAAHLLRRVTFGPNPALIRNYTGFRADVGVPTLLANQPVPPVPIHPTMGNSWHNLPFLDTDEGPRTNSLKAWWAGLMAAQNTTLEKMVLFWQNHFVTSFSTVNDARFMYRYLANIRRHALGNFRSLVIDMTKDASMLIYLNGNGNVAGRPNQNYARELQELFTIGRGNYTEDDVQAAARVLTGWRVSGYRSATTPDINVTFNVAQHDTGDKQFSASYQNTVIRGRRDATAGDTELGELVDMILRQPETARFIVRKLYRWFINFDISPEVEREFIEPLAKIFRDNRYEIRPVLTAMFQSEHFYDQRVRAAIIKSPLDLVLGTLRMFGQAVPDMASQTAAFYQYTNYVWLRSRELQMDILDQPTVFGWRPYYDTGFYDIWISSTTLTLRNSFTDVMVTGNQRVGTARLGIDTLAMAQAAPNPGDPEALVDYLDGILFATDLSKVQKDFLIDQVLITGGNPRYNWTLEWNEYQRTPNNATLRNSVKMKLDSLTLYMLRMAEYQVA